MLEFSYRPQVFYGLYRGYQRSEGTLIEQSRDDDVLAVISFLLILVEKSVVKLWPSQAAGDMKNNIHEE